MRRRTALAPEAAPIPDPVYVEDWVDPIEPGPALPEELSAWRADPLPGEPAAAVPWRVLAEERVDAARHAAHRPASGLTEETRLHIVPVRPERPATPPPVAPGWFGARCLWRDSAAFLAEVDRAHR